MKAVYINSFGDDYAIELREVPEPKQPTGSQVLIQVRAAGLNRADLLQARGLYPPPEGFSPNIPGLEFAGIVEEIGDAVSSFSIGTRVFGITAGEAQAEYLLTDESLITAVPPNLGFREAAAVPEAFITAHDALRVRARLEQGEFVLIHAVGSGVGLAALQLAKAGGAKVIGTSRTSDKLDRCREIGLDLALPTADGPVFADAVREYTAGKGADVILDLTGAAYLRENLNSLALKGRLILIGLTSGARAEADLSVILRKRATVIGTVLRSRSDEEKAEATRRFADHVVPLLEAGVVEPNLDRTFGAKDVVDAYQYLASNESFGKVVLEF